MMKSTMLGVLACAAISCGGPRADEASRVTEGGRDDRGLVLPGPAQGLVGTYDGRLAGASKTCHVTVDLDEEGVIKREIVRFAVSAGDEQLTITVPRFELEQAIAARRSADVTVDHTRGLFTTENRNWLRFELPSRGDMRSLEVGELKGEGLIVTPDNQQVLTCRGLVRVVD